MLSSMAQAHEQRCLGILPTMQVQSWLMALPPCQ